VLTWAAWLALAGKRPTQPALRCVLSVHSASVLASAWAASMADTTSAIECIGGPEGGLSPSEEAAAIASGYQPVGLGPRVLRSETAPLAALCIWTLV
jgi:16S rRNA (uracil1498-N3)-methyltransferase